MRLVILESPYAGDVRGNVAYLTRCLRDSLLRNEAPFASHGLYPGALDDDEPDERSRGIESGLAWARHAAATVVYCDRGISSGMRIGVQHALACGRTVEWRSLTFGKVQQIQAEELSAQFLAAFASGRVR